MKTILRTKAERGSLVLTSPRHVYPRCADSKRQAPRETEEEMKAIDMLRAISRNSTDSDMAFRIEMWIGEHCLELSNSVAIGFEDQKSDALEHYSKSLLKEMASRIIDEAPLTEDDLWIGPNRMNVPVKKYTRTVAIIRERK